jgi:hypothetical protein
MMRLATAALLLCLILPAQVIAPSGITCCDEQKIRQAMAEEALQRIAARFQGGAGATLDYLSEQAFAIIRRRLPAGSRDQIMDFLRAALRQPAPDEEIREFQERVGYFVLGMTLEIGITFQDEYDRARQNLEKIGKLLGELEILPAADEAGLDRALFHAAISERELRRIRGLERRWKEVAPELPPFDEFNILKRNVSGSAPDPDQWMVFAMAARYREHFPFLDEFLENYRRLAADFREAARQLSQRLTLLAQYPSEK